MPRAQKWQKIQKSREKGDKHRKTDTQHGKSHQQNEKHHAHDLKLGFEIPAHGIFDAVRGDEKRFLYVFRHIFPGKIS